MIFLVFAILKVAQEKGSIPLWEKKFLSSAEINAFIKLFGILSIGTNILSSIKYLSNKTPSDVKTLEDKLGL